MDHIALDRLIFKALGAGDTLSFDGYWEGSKAHDTTDRIIYNNVTGSIFYDSDGSGKAGQVLIGTVTIGTDLSNTDFLII